MKTIFRKSFVRDLKRFEKDKNLLTKIHHTILEVEAAESINTHMNLKKLKAEGPYYRIKVGNYRVGITIKDATATFIRLLHRSDIYRYFP